MFDRQFIIQRLSMLTYLFFPIIVLSEIIHIPDNYETIQEGINAAIEGDTVLIDSGTFTLDTLVVNKRLILASGFIVSKDTADISHTTIKASPQAEKEWFLVNPAATGTKIIGLKIEGNSQHSMGIANIYTEVIHCKFIGGKDQLSLEGSSSQITGGYVGYCYFDGAGDDGIDCDNTGNWIIEHNTIINAHQDGIEVRLQPKSGPLTSHIFRYNIIINPGESGIQLINYPEDSFREIQIYGNIFKNCQGSGVSCMYNTETNEDYHGSDMEETAKIYNNTFDNCNYGLTEAPNLIILNNIFVNCKTKGIARGSYVTNDNDNSIVDYCDFYGNHIDYDVDISIGSNIFYFDPKFESTTTYELSQGSQAIDAGTAAYSWQDQLVLNIPISDYFGSAPDLGATEYGILNNVFESNYILPLEMKLYQNYPNPFNPTTTITFYLAHEDHITLKIFNTLGQEIVTIVNDVRSAGRYKVSFNGFGLSSGIYFYQLITSNFRTTRKMNLIQ